MGWFSGGAAAHENAFLKWFPVSMLSNLGGWLVSEPLVPLWVEYRCGLVFLHYFSSSIFSSSNASTFLLLLIIILFRDASITQLDVL